MKSAILVGVLVVFGVAAWRIAAAFQAVTIEPPVDAVVMAQPVVPPSNPWWLGPDAGYPPTYIDGSNSRNDGLNGIVWVLQEFTMPAPDGNPALPYLSRIFAVEFDCFNHQHRTFYDSFFDGHKGAGKIVKQGAGVMLWQEDAWGPDKLRKRACPAEPD